MAAPDGVGGLACPDHRHLDHSGNWAQSRFRLSECGHIGDTKSGGMADSSAFQWLGAIASSDSLSVGEWLCCQMPAAQQGRGLADAYVRDK